jgi:hypothetical protein
MTVSSIIYPIGTQFNNWGFIYRKITYNKVMFIDFIGPELYAKKASTERIGKIYNNGSYDSICRCSRRGLLALRHVSLDLVREKRVEWSWVCTVSGPWPCYHGRQLGVTRMGWPRNRPVPGRDEGRGRTRVVRTALSDRRPL